MERRAARYSREDFTHPGYTWPVRTPISTPTIKVLTKVI